MAKPVLLSERNYIQIVSSKGASCAGIERLDPLNFNNKQTSSVSIYLAHVAPIKDDEELRDGGYFSYTVFRPIFEKPRAVSQNGVTRDVTFDKGFPYIPKRAVSTALKELGLK